jgi:hypothetical protein
MLARAKRERSDPCPSYLDIHVLAVIKASPHLLDEEFYTF